MTSAPALTPSLRWAPPAAFRFLNKSRRRVVFVRSSLFAETSRTHPFSPFFSRPPPPFLSFISLFVRFFFSLAFLSLCAVSLLPPIPLNLSLALKRSPALFTGPAVLLPTPSSFPINAVSGIITKGKFDRDLKEAFVARLISARCCSSLESIAN